MRRATMPFFDHVGPLAVKSHRDTGRLAASFVVVASED
jgi:hypothetical protein